MEATLDGALPQTALSDAGANAALIQNLTLWMSIAGLVITLIVMAAIGFAWRSRDGGKNWWIIVGGVVFPLAVLTVLFVASSLTLRTIAWGKETGTVIEVTGHQFWWNVIYEPEGRALRDANEIFVPVGEPVTFRLRSDDVIHSFWVPSLSGKMDMIPGRVNEMTVTASEEGRFRGQCAEFCGRSHPLMAFEVVAVPPDEFEALLADLEGEAPDPILPQHERGRDVFLQSGCAACHEIRGVAEGARKGPDLTRIGARAALGAGMWQMNTGNLSGWIANVREMKPEAQMPNYNHLSGPDLRAVVAYLESLK